LSNKNLKIKANDTIPKTKRYFGSSHSIGSQHTIAFQIRTTKNTFISNHMSLAVYKGSRVSGKMITAKKTL
jgi:hypothetical protein